MKQMRELAAAYAFQRSSQSKNTGVGPVEAALRFVDVHGSGRLGKCAHLVLAALETRFNSHGFSCEQCCGSKCALICGKAAMGL